MSEEGRKYWGDTTETDEGKKSDNGCPGESSVASESSDERKEPYNLRPRKQGASWWEESKGGFGAVKVRTGSETEGSDSESEESDQESESSEKVTQMLQWR